MPIGVIVRKMVAYNRIESLPLGEKERAYKLYALLDQIEFLTFIPFYLGLYFILALFFMGDNFPSDPVVILLYMGLLYALGVFTLKKLFFNPYRKRKVEKLRATFLSDSTYKSIIKALERIDPDLFKNIRKHIT